MALSSSLASNIGGLTNYNKSKNIRVTYLLSSISFKKYQNTLLINKIYIPIKPSPKFEFFSLSFYNIKS